MSNELSPCKRTKDRERENEYSILSLRPIFLCFTLLCFFCFWYGHDDELFFFLMFLSSWMDFKPILSMEWIYVGDLDVSMRSGETHDERMERESHSWHASSSQEEEQEQEGNRKRGSRRRRRSGGGGGSASLVKKSSLYESMRADGHPAAERTDRPPDWYASMRWGKRFLMILGSSGLACLGGIINGIAVGGVFPLGLTHLTSTTTYAGVIAVAPQLDFKGVELWFCAVITLCFIAGTSERVWDLSI